MAPDIEPPSQPRVTILQAGEPVLRTPARALSVEEIRSSRIHELIDQMRYTLREAPGVGLAAPQIGEPLRLAVIEDRLEYHRDASAASLAEKEREPVPFYVIINPELSVIASQPVEFFEGCLSLAGFTAIVPRARAVRVHFLDERGLERTIEASGWHARILQHEIDHLDGRLYVDRMESRSFMSVAPYVRHWKDKSIAQIRAELMNFH